MRSQSGSRDPADYKLEGPAALRVLFGQCGECAWYKILVRSMTGYGRGQSEGGGCRVTVEIRSVNHRFLDLKLRGAALEPAQEEKLRQLVGKTVTRGALSLSTRVDRGGTSTELHVDQAIARRAHNELRQLSDLLGMEGEVPLSMICNQPGVMVAAESDPESDQEAAGLLAEQLLQAGGDALAELAQMRLTEGSILRRDLESRLTKLRELATELAEHARDTPEVAQKRLQERIDRLLKHSKVEVDPARLAQEVAIVADKLDITEELVRVSAHLEQLAELIGKTEPVGRKLDFLVQELGREFNTVTSKSQSAKVAHLVVEAKAEMEKIREQVQNIE
jgi:uncharacterized protein (TIGR00255 family)